jgi:1-phosphofructokinase family hexose kinase
MVTQRKPGLHSGRIITIGLSPAWDISCRGAGLDWDRHVDLDEQVIRPAGKAMNVSYALAWIGRPSIAAGLWGREDYDQMRGAVRRLGRLIEPRMTLVEGRTRQNITVVDTRRHREMHLRCKSTLASEQGLRKLNANLTRLTHKGDTCIFAGVMPGGDLLGPVVDLVCTCRRAEARILVDTYGPPLAGIVGAGLPWLISPNVEELRELLDRRVPNTPVRLAAAARTLLGKVEVVLVSRGAEGALLVTRSGVWTGRSRTRRKALSTVGCGDYLLAGFLAGFDNTRDPRAALATGLKVAAARAWGWTETKRWPQADKEIEVSIIREDSRV